MEHHSRAQQICGSQCIRSSGTREDVTYSLIAQDKLVVQVSEMPGLDGIENEMPSLNVLMRE
eukprot:1160669-Pelagomonas_calceolata.AAC.12